MKLLKFKFHDVDLAVKPQKKNQELEGLFSKLLNSAYAVLLVICSSARNKTS